MKNKKAADRSIWKVEWIKEGGEEMMKSLSILFNRIKTENKIPIQWQLTTVKNTHKGGVKGNIQSTLKYKIKRKMRICHKCKQQGENKDKQII